MTIAPAYATGTVVMTYADGTFPGASRARLVVNDVYEVP